MDNKFKNLFSDLGDDDLTFTKEDRMETIKKIRKKNNKRNPNKNTTIFHIGRRYAGPILGTVMVFFLAIGLLLPNLYSGNEFIQDNRDKQQASQNESLSFSALVMGSKSTNNRSNIYILLTYNSGDNSLKLVPIPRDTYVEIFDSEGKMIRKDKLIHASTFDSSHNPVMKTVSNLFDFTIDYYSVIPEEKLYTALEVDEDETWDIRVNTNEIGERLSFSQMKNLLKESETNIPSNILNQMERNDSESIQVIDMEKGIEETYINEIFYVKINQNTLETTANTLKQHMGDK